ncbi:VCBS repeat-containing protein [Deinococcus taeanensis]|uniref:VCBS repeat-containing protein n=1 Tax=Deinococcus taeanensis TaxID=2737050 RepID=UPI001CDBDF3D|nr:VCBS repeat-containing protein [Deinococcus taeanensis]UBV41941.1 VCBS repeat-containing protein [Deinococcus taeanensis]
MRALLPLALLLLTAQAAPPSGLHPALAVMPGDQTAYLLGGASGGRWLTPGQVRPLLTGQERYVRLAPGQPRVTVRGRHADTLGEPCEATLTVPLTPAPAGLAVFTSPALAAQPRPVVALPTTNATYTQIMQQELRRRGLLTPRVTLTRLVRTDLDGNGTQEIILEASQYRDRSGPFPPPVGRPGDYSLLLLRQVRSGQAVTTVLGAHVAPQRPWDAGDPAPMPMATLHRLAGVADLNGDGRMEVIVHSAYYEGAGFSVQEWTPAGLKSTPLGSGCGV